MSHLSASPAWEALAAHSKKTGGVRMTDLFRGDPQRFQKFSIHLDGMLFDYSKNPLTDETIRLLLDLAKERNLEQQRAGMFSGEKINTTENRAVLHTALRSGANTEVQDVLSRMKDFTGRIHGEGKITDIVNIGIGGSSLGPQLVTEALAQYHRPGLKAHFVANVEASDLENTLRKLSPETTLFVIASKTFTTAETMQNAEIALAWFLKNSSSAAVARHFVAVSTNLDAVKNFGIAPENMFPFWDWVGGRYSVWSAIGLSVMLMVGAENFFEFLIGARAMDEHFKSAPLDKNMPVMMALAGLWHRNFLERPAYACIPYHASLRRLAAWLQQLDMESNGKSVDKDGKPVDYATGPMVFGEPGTDAQHSFFQWLHQSPTEIPVDFIAAVKTSCGKAQQQNMLLANCLAQSEALMKGQANEKEPHRNFPGNRPSNTILLDALTPRTLGMLLALYEHRVFVQGVIWNINSFDQWGVELGKVMAKKLQAEIEARKPGEHDGSTRGLMEHYINKSNS